MLVDTKPVYVCAACSHRIEAVEQPCQCPKCHAVGKTRDFPTEENATIAKQNDLLRLGLLIDMPKGMKARVVYTPGIQAKGPVFIRTCSQLIQVLEGNLDNISDFSR